MNMDTIQKAEELKRKRRRKKQWNRLLTCLSVVIMLCTTYVLMLPALTLESSDGEESPCCGFADFVVHTHDDNCYDDNGVLWCELPEIQEHEHAEICYEVLDIIDEDEQHVHTAACYGEVHTPSDAEVHSPSDADYNTSDAEVHSPSDADCNISDAEVHSPSNAGVHTPGNASSYDGVPLCGILTPDDELEKELTCTLTEAVLHNHDSDCWNEDGSIGCGQLQVEAHQHTDACMEKSDDGIHCSFTVHTHTDACYETPAVAMMALVDSPMERDDDLVTAGTDRGITFRLFNYDADINNNGHSKYFTFRGTCIHNPDNLVGINKEVDADGYVAKRAKVEPALKDGYPVFDAGNAENNFSLGYLFGDGGNGVTEYSPDNTPLLYDETTNHYSYDSAENAVDYDIMSETFLVRSYEERGDSTAGFGSKYADFMPFTYWDGKTTFTHTNGTEYYYDSDQELDYWFGMTMDAEFFQPKDGNVAEEKDMVFEFSGDDDVWVFIDDVLVLDLGGTHGVVTGSINFATGEVIQHLDWAGSTTPSYPTTIKNCFEAAGKKPNGGWNENETTFADYTTHTIRFFYLERGAGSANCKLSFNLPTLPDKSLTVTKDVLQGENSEAKDYISDHLAYRFRVVKADADGNPTESLFVPEGTVFELLEDGTATGKTGTVDSSGYFELKAGQSAQFTNMLELGGGAASYIVEEIMPDGLTGQYETVEYQVSNTTGATKTGEGPETELTSFHTEALSAEEIQAVTYRNRVDTTQLSRLQISKASAPGASFADGTEFSIQVRLDGELLAAGTKYVVGEEERKVQTGEDGMTTGCVVLKIGETAVLSDGILSGTSYEIREIGTEEGNFNASYTGTVQTGSQEPESVIYDLTGAAGEFPLDSNVHVTVTNASYDFRAEIPIWKECIDNEETMTFSFAVESVTGNPGDGWISESALPGTNITVDDSEVTGGMVVIGYDAGTNGKFYYRISEQEEPSEDYIFDDTYYIVEVTVDEDQASVTNIWKDGTETVDIQSMPVLFVNQKTTAVVISKEITGFAGSQAPDRQFRFQAAVKDREGNPMILAEGPSGSDYIVNEEGMVEFTLGHGQNITLFYIPIGAVVEVCEIEHEGYIPYYKTSVNAEAVYGDTAVISGTTRNISYLYFENKAGYELPETGGSGIKWYTLGGLLLLLSAAEGFLMYRRNYHRRKGLQA